MELFLSIYDGLFVIYRDDVLAKLLTGAEQGICNILGLTFIVSSLLTALFFYKIRDYASDNKSKIWFLWLGAIALVNAAFAFGLVYKFTHDEISMVTAVLFGISNAIVTSISFFVWSLVVKRWSNNLCHVPF